MRDEPQGTDPRIAYLVVGIDSGNSYETQRVYLDLTEAESFVEAYNAVGADYLEVEEIALGAPAVAYDGPVWLGAWTTRRKQKGEKQLVLVADGFTTVVPSAVPSVGGYRYTEFFGGPEWRDLAKPLEYEEPPVWIDSFYFRQEWCTGDNPSTAAIDVSRGRDDHIEVRGTSKDAVEALLRSAALQVKAEHGIA